MSLALVSTAVLSLPLTARADLAIDQNSVKGSRDCGSGAAAVNGNYNVLTFTNCHEVAVNGNHNQVDTGGATSVSVMGNDNTVTWHASPEGVSPRVANLGSRNVVSAAKTTAAPVAGTPETHTTSGAGAPATGVQVGSGIKVDANGVQVGSGIKVDANGVTVGTTHVQTGAGNQPFVVNFNAQIINHDCEGGVATVNGDRNTVTLRNCARVDVKGNANSVDAGSPSTLSVLGDRNDVSWRDAPGGTQVSNLGTGNSMTRK